MYTLCKQSNDLKVCLLIKLLQNFLAILAIFTSENSNDASKC